MLAPITDDILAVNVVSDSPKPVKDVVACPTFIGDIEC